MNKNTTNMNLSAATGFLTALKVQLENSDAVAVDNSRSQYGNLIPEVKTKNERKAFTVNSLRMGQARVIGDAILAIDLLRERKRKKRKKASEATED